MNVFRDSTATLLDRIHRLEKEIARLRRRELRHRSEVIRIFARIVLQSIGVMICVAIAFFVITFLMFDIPHA